MDQFCNQSCKREKINAWMTFYPQYLEKMASTMDAFADEFFYEPRGTLPEHCFLLARDAIKASRYALHFVDSRRVTPEQMRELTALDELLHRR